MYIFIDSSLPQKITILPSSISSASETVIKKLFESKNLLNKTDANCVEELLELGNLKTVSQQKLINKNFKNNKNLFCF